MVSAWLSVSKRIAHVAVVQDEDSLCQQLSDSNNCNLCIIVVDREETALPACTLHYPDMRLLVLTANQQTGKFMHWLQQGATDVVTMHEFEAAQHAISRLIDECVADLQQGSLRNRIEQLEHETQFLKSMLEKEKRSFVISASNDAQHERDNQSVSARVEDDLRCDEAPQIKNVIADEKLSDMNSDSLAQASVVERFHSMMNTEVKAPRFTAMLVRILGDKDIEDLTGDEKTAQDLTLFRAVDTLQKNLVKGTILGRVKGNALLLIQSSDIEPVSRDAANRVRDTLGSLGGLIDSERDIHINTMTLPAKTRISVDEMVTRLAAHG